jgi:hypothetical protein
VSLSLFGCVFFGPVVLGPLFARGGGMIEMRGN